MTYLAYAGFVLVCAGVLMLARCILKAQEVRAGRVESESVESALNRLIRLNAVAMAVAFLGLALMVVGMLLG